MAAIFVVVQAAALLLVPVFPSDYRAFEDANDPVNPLLYFFLIIVVTVIVLLLVKYGRGGLLRAIFFGAIAVTLTLVFTPIFFALYPDVLVDLLLAIALTAVLIGLMILRPEWYTIDAVALIAGIGVTAVLGISLGLLPAIILLVMLAVYDAVAVYWTKHMVSLAGGVASLKLPVVFVVPKSRDFSMAQLKKEDVTSENKEREAMFMGVGDAVIPGILVVSAYSFLPQAAGGIAGANLIVAVGALIGGLLGYALLMRFVLTGRPQAGLPLLNGGTIAGFIVSYLLVFQDLGFGIF